MTSVFISDFSQNIIVMKLDQYYLKDPTLYRGLSVTKVESTDLSSLNPFSKSFKFFLDIRVDFWVTLGRSLLIFSSH